MSSNPSATPDSDLVRLVRSRFGGLYQQGAGLLKAFAEACPTDFSFLLPSDIRVRTNSAFAGMAEWDELAEHIACCKRCHV